tara:strand:+ start:492 stop:1196 length:705 start_codon:yes stop_codon:yes gene_type:complete
LKSFTYLFVNLSCIIIPLIASFYKDYPFFKSWKYFFKANLIVAFLFIVHDIYFTSLGVWFFNSDYLINFLDIFNLPIEEVLFFICIPYACVFTYFVFTKYVSENLFPVVIYQIVLNFLILLTLVSSILNYEYLYTFYTSIFLFLMLIYVKLKKFDIRKIILSYIAIVPFFFLSNGILTGSFIESPIVNYDNNENLNLRMFTIPVEDIFYGFLLIMSNCLLFDYFKYGSIKRISN